MKAFSWAASPVFQPLDKIPTLKSLIAYNAFKAVQLGRGVIASVRRYIAPHLHDARAGELARRK